MHHNISENSLQATHLQDQLSTALTNYEEERRQSDHFRALLEESMALVSVCLIHLQEYNTNVT
jgi:aspartokinase